MVSPPPSVVAAMWPAICAKTITAKELYDIFYDLLKDAILDEDRQWALMAIGDAIGAPLVAVIIT
jgi:hypothetical protein